MPHEYYWWGPMWVMPMIMPLILIAVLVVFLYLFFGKGGPKPPWESGREGETALEILKKRYARGEITKEEFDRMKRDILS